MGKFDESLGNWCFDIGGVELELHPEMDDFKNFRKLVMLHPDNQKDKNGMFTRFSDLLFELISKENPEEDQVKVRTYIELNINSLFEEAMVFFRWTTREQLAKAQSAQQEDLKKLMSGD